MSSSDLGWLNDRQRDGGIDRIRLPDTVSGSLFVCGKHAIAARFATGAWDTVVCLVERHELEHRYPDYLGWLVGAGDRVIWQPVPDLHAPSLDTMTNLAEDVIARLHRGERVIVHCAAGKGRAGTTAVCILVALGMPLEGALERVAASRPGAGPEVGAQRELVAELAAWHR